ncbi:MAG TPA: hypothetical protein DHV62_05280 [Elusimicrobia bacterium]|nr:hypothetical protein [Elusimicrobiota bacterium]
MKTSKKYYLILIVIVLILPIIFLSKMFAETKNDLIIFWLVDRKEGEKIETYRYFVNLLEKYPQLHLNLSFSPPVLQNWVTRAPDLVEKLKSLQGKKQISIVFPPFYEPVLPLLYDYNPVVSFSYPIDIREQMARSWELYQQFFDSLPNGIVPPAGAISSAILDLLSEFEIKWIVTGGEEISEGGYAPFVQYLTDAGEVVYLFFRENKLSEYRDRISPATEYSLNITSAKEKVKQWIAQIVDKNYPLTVVTLEGIPRAFTADEKEYEIVKQLFEQIVQGKFVTYTAENYILKNPSAKRTMTLKPLSWREDGFSAWTDKIEKRAAWKLLEQARSAVEKYKNSGQAEIKTLDNILEEIYFCESGDNFLHFGEAAYENSEKIELNFRLKLVNIYRLIGQPIPEELFHPLASYSFFGSLPSEEETKIEIDENERLFSLLDPSGDSFDERFDLENFSCRERVNSLDKEEIVFSFTFSNPIVLTEVVTSTEVITFSEVDTSIEPVVVSTEEAGSLQETIASENEVITSTGFYVIESSTPTEIENKVERIFVDLYIDLNNRVGAGSVALLPGRRALTIPEDAWEYCLTTEINTSGIKEAKLYRAKENNSSQKLGEFPVVINSSYTFSVDIPKEILYGKPMNWGYLVAIFKETVYYQEGDNTQKVNSEEMEIIDLIIPRGKTQKQVLSDSKLNPSLSAVRIR